VIENLIKNWKYSGNSKSLALDLQKDCIQILGKLQGY
jgi:hypothetical protein